MDLFQLNEFADWGLEKSKIKFNAFDFSNSAVEHTNVLKMSEIPSRIFCYFYIYPSIYLNFYPVSLSIILINFYKKLF